jgi:hypothetical protein
MLALAGVCDLLTSPGLGTLKKCAGGNTYEDIGTLGVAGLESAREAGRGVLKVR